MRRAHKASEKERTIDLLERIGAGLLYTKTHLSQTEVAKVLGVDNNRINKILKGIAKEK
jgi:plasmid maintenance system antidote protein VapI